MWYPDFSGSITPEEFQQMMKQINEHRQKMFREAAKKFGCKVINLSGAKMQPGDLIESFIKENKQ